MNKKHLRSTMRALAIASTIATSATSAFAAKQHEPPTCVAFIEKLHWAAREAHVALPENQYTGDPTASGSITHYFRSNRSSVGGWVDCKRNFKFFDFMYGAADPSEENGFKAFATVAVCALMPWRPKIKDCAAIVDKAVKGAHEEFVRFVDLGAGSYESSITKCFNFRPPDIADFHD